MVPVLVVMSGSLAFSAFQGSITTNVNTTAGVLSFSQDLSLIGSDATNTAVTVSCSETGNQVTVGGPSPGSMPFDLGTVSSSSSSISQTVEVTNFAPLDYVIIEVTITNTGTVGMTVGWPQIVSNPTVPSWEIVNNSVYWGPTNLGWLEGVPGFCYAYYNFAPTSTPPVTLAPGDSATYYLSIALGSYGNQNSLQDSTLSLTLTTDVTSSP